LEKVTGNTFKDGIATKETVSKTRLVSAFDSDSTISVKSRFDIVKSFSSSSKNSLANILRTENLFDVVKKLEELSPKDSK
jgi:hypothetical protein